MEAFENLKEVQASSRELFQGKILHLYEDTVTLPNGKTAIREVVRHIGAVCVIPVTADGKAVVERQFRYAIGMEITEIPAGKLNSRQEDPLEAAKRELQEETGITARTFVDLGVFYPAAAYSDEKIRMYLALDLSWGKRELDEDEFLNVELVSLKNLVADAMAGRIPDAKTQLAVLKAAKYLGI